MTTTTNSISGIEIPSHLINDTCIQDACARLRNAIDTCGEDSATADKARSDLRSWINSAPELPPQNRFSNLLDDTNDATARAIANAQLRDDIDTFELGIEVLERVEEAVTASEEAPVVKPAFCTVASLEYAASYLSANRPITPRGFFTMLKRTTSFFSVVRGEGQARRLDKFSKRDSEYLFESMVRRGVIYSSVDAFENEDYRHQPGARYSATVQALTASKSTKKTKTQLKLEQVPGFQALTLEKLDMAHCRTMVRTIRWTNDLFAVDVEGLFTAHIYHDGKAYMVTTREDVETLDHHINLRGVYRQLRNVKVSMTGKGIAMPRWTKNATPEEKAIDALNRARSLVALLDDSTLDTYLMRASKRLSRIASEKASENDSKSD